MKTYVIAGVLLATIGGSLPAYAADLGPGRARPIRTETAAYGDLASQKICNAAPAIAAQCDGQVQCVVPVSNGLCGDPAYLIVKQIRVDFRCGRRVRSAVGAEYGTIALACQ